MDVKMRFPSCILIGFSLRLIESVSVVSKTTIAVTCKLCYIIYLFFLFGDDVHSFMLNVHICTRGFLNVTSALLLLSSGHLNARFRL